MKQVIIFFIFAAIISVNTAQSNSSYIRNGSVGKTTNKADTLSKRAFSFIPISNWVGERFIFLPQDKDLRHYGYMDFHISYEKYVGRIAKVISVDKNGYFYKITLKMEDDGAELSTTIYTEAINCLAPIADIDSARSHWLNKTLWYKSREISQYNEKDEKELSVKIKKYSAVKVIDIVAGWYNHKPVRFIVQSPNGDEGYVDINLSGTNVTEILRDGSSFEGDFFTKDPREMHKWSRKIWNAIEEEKVFIGMTPDQAKLSWGLPKNINRTHTGSGISEQWVFSSGSYLYFENGILKTIQN